MKKINSIFEISELIAREMSGSLSQQEKEQLGKWLNNSELNQHLHQRIIDSGNLAKRNSLFENVNTEKAWNKVSEVFVTPRKRHLFPRLVRYAAAVMIPIIIGIPAYLYLNEKPQKIAQTVAEVETGTHNTVLIMANGENVNLDNIGTQNLVEKDGTVIKNINDELNYSRQSLKNTKKTLLNTLIVPQGGEYNLVLSDGTRVFVNSMSKLVFPVSFTGLKRELTLEGEAYFEVAKNESKPFIVTIRGLQVEVLGTSFNIKAYPNDNKSFTTLVEGKVKLKSDCQTSKISFLEPDQQAIYDPSTTGIVVKKVDAKQVVQWITGKYSFTNQPLDEIMKTLSRWYDFNYQFEDESLKNIKFEGGLNKYECIDPILDIIKKTGKVKVSVKGKEILISKI